MHKKTMHIEKSKQIWMEGVWLDEQFSLDTWKLMDDWWHQSSNLHLSSLHDELAKQLQSSKVINHRWSAEMHPCTVPIAEVEKRARFFHHNTCVALLLDTYVPYWSAHKLRLFLLTWKGRRTKREDPPLCRGCLDTSPLPLKQEISATDGSHPRCARPTTDDQ